MSRRFMNAAIRLMGSMRTGFASGSGVFSLMLILTGLAVMNSEAHAQYSTLYRQFEQRSREDAARHRQMSESSDSAATTMLFSQIARQDDQLVENYRRLAEQSDAADRQDRAWANRRNTNPPASLPYYSGYSSSYVNSIGLNSGFSGASYSPYTYGGYSSSYPSSTGLSSGFSTEALPEHD